MDIFQTLILSIIEGVTEFLPISSTGHLVLVSKILNIPQSDFVKSFEIVIQSGAIMAVLVLYGKRLLTDQIKNVLIGFIPTGIIGFGLYKLIKNFLIGNLTITLLALFLGGLAMILLERIFKNKKGSSLNKLSVKQALIIGTAQSLSVIPGVSRSAATILGGMGVGLSREAAVEFSFLLAIPTMILATGYDLVKSYNQFSKDDVLTILIGFIASFIVAFLTIKWFIKFIKINTLIPFGIYRIILSIVFWVFLIYG